MASNSKTIASTDYTPAEVYCGLRDRILQLRAMPAAGPNGVVAALAEVGLEVVVTLAVLADGATSLYFSNGGGMIGAGEHKLVAVTALKFIGAAEQAQQLMQPVTACPLPRPKHVRFYVLSSAGIIRSAELPEAQFSGPADSFSPLYRLAHNVIAAVRKIHPPTGVA